MSFLKTNLIDISLVNFSVFFFFFCRSFSIVEKSEKNFKNDLPNILPNDTSPVPDTTPDVN